MESVSLLNADFIESRYRLWKSDPRSVSREWQVFFQGFELAASLEEKRDLVPGRQELFLQSRLEELIHRYRDLGHLLACLDPLVSCPTDHPLLSLSALGFEEEDLDRVFTSPHFNDMGDLTLRELLKMLKETYCRSIGVEYMHLQDPSERRWLQERMEPIRNRPVLEKDAKVRILNRLYQATLFEQFLHSKYVGQKRFSMEGAEVVVAMLDTLVNHAGGLGCREIILGMAHRGRLNIQVNVLGKLYEAVMCEFEDSYDPDSLVGSGDVKYHKGYLADVRVPGHQPVRVLLVSNSSHLESVDPVAEGIARGRQERMGKDGHRLVLPTLIHGDAAFAGEGIVSETLNLSQLQGYHTGGTLHVVINNQIGFTTLPDHARSTRYSTDVAKMLMVPVFHVHGENPEAAVHVMKLACDYRMEFAKDVVIDLVCYRKYGHNEGDEPYFTQPKMYERIKERQPTHRIYAGQLLEEGVITQEEVESIQDGINQCLSLAYQAAHDKTCSSPETNFYEEWQDIQGEFSHEPVQTGVSDDLLIWLARRISGHPPGFSVHPRLGRILERRLATVKNGEGIDWATAEALALGSLLMEGIPVRFSGQDCRRGTFSQRHAVLVDVKTGEEFIPLNSLDAHQAPLFIYDSMLSENAVLGFEYGYSLVSPGGLVIWEAQFGDFANNAQAVIDQYISSGQSKWGRLSGLVLLLPHGMEGQGPEHSSARIERFLQLCAEDNLQVCNPTTPSQYFHLLRRQIKGGFRKPLIVMSPKSLLRRPLAVSPRDELASGHFREVLDDIEPSEKPTRVLLCSGKIFYELIEKRRDSKSSQCVIVRLEQFYPFPQEQLRRLLSGYSRAEEWCWVQEEPENMGGWRFVRPLLQSLIGREIRFCGRPAAASPASGYHKMHKIEQDVILGEAFA